MVNAVVTLIDLGNVTADIPFLVDTGATITTIHPPDALSRLKLSAAQLSTADFWPLHDTVRGVGGLTRQFRVRAQYKFTHQDGMIQLLTGNVRIAQLRPEATHLPSLLGWDVLQHFELVTDWVHQRVWLRNPGMAT